MPTDTSEQISLAFVLTMLTAFGIFGFSESFRYLREKLKGRARGATTSLYGNLTSHTLFVPDPVEEENERWHAEIQGEMHPFIQNEQALSRAGVFGEAVQRATHQFERSQQTMTEMSRQISQQMQQMQSMHGTIPMPVFHDPTRVNPNNCTHDWQEFPLINRPTLRICNLCGSTESAGELTFGSTPSCTQHNWNNPIVMMHSKTNEPYRHFVCRDCGRTKSEKIRPMTIAEARLKKVRSIFLED